MTSPAASLTDEQLLDRARTTGDAESCDELRRRHTSDARRVARIVAHDHDEADALVADGFDRVFASLRAGDGPDHALVPYLRTVIRRLAVDRHRVGTAEFPAAEPAAVEDLPTADDELDGVDDRHLVRDAFETLPDRWQRALWFTEIEGRPKEALIPDLGSVTNAVAALAYRAREGLRQAYLAVHLSAMVPDACKAHIPKLPAYIREALSPEEDVAVAMHLDSCLLCRSRRYELLVLVSNLRSVLAPALLGYVTSEATVVGAIDAGAVGVAGAGLAGAGVAPVAAVPARGIRRLRPRNGLQVATTTIVSAAAAAVVAYAAVSAIAPSAADETGRSPQAIAADIAPQTSSQTQAGPPPAVTVSPFEELEDEPEDDAPSVTETAARGAVTPPAEEPESASETQQDRGSDQPAPARPSDEDVPEDEPADKPAKSSPSEESPEESGDGEDEPEEDDRPDDEQSGPPWLCKVIPSLPWCES